MEVHGKVGEKGGIYNNKDLLNFSPTMIPTMKPTIVETSMYKHTLENELKLSRMPLLSAIH